MAEAGLRAKAIAALEVGMPPVEWGRVGGLQLRKFWGWDLGVMELDLHALGLCSPGSDSQRAPACPEPRVIAHGLVFGVVATLPTLATLAGVVGVTLDGCGLLPFCGVVHALPGVPAPVPARCACG